VIRKGSCSFKYVCKTSSGRNHARIEFGNIAMRRVPVIIFILPHDSVVDSDHDSDLSGGESQVKAFPGPFLDNDYDLFWSAAEQTAVRQHYDH